MAFIQWLGSINQRLNGIVWGVPMLLLILGTGICLHMRTQWFSFKRFGHAMRHTLGGITRKQKTGKGEITPAQAVTTALAATMGTGNIAGVAGAITLGGPGAVFWMWVSALLGMATKYAEVMLAIRFRKRNRAGDWVGGPMYYITNGLGRQWRFLSMLFALLAALAAFGIGNMTQANTVASSILSAIAEYAPLSSGSQASMRVIIGMIMAGFVALVILGGVKRIGTVTEKLIPAISLVYIVCSLIVIFRHIGNMGAVCHSILQGACNPSAAIGGAVGITIADSMKRGVGRGVFSNEAGLGSAPIAHAASSEKNPVKQGLYGIFEVFMDTIVSCSLTAFAILASGIAIPYGQSAGVELSMAAFSTVLGNAGNLITVVSVVLFAVSTIISWSLYGARCCEYLFGEKAIRPYQVLFVIAVVLGSTMELGLVWDIADTLNGMMAIPNLIALLGLSGLIGRLTREYDQTLR